MDEEGHLKIADFGLAMDNMWLGEKIVEDTETGTPSYVAPEVSLISSLTNNKLLETNSVWLGYRMIADKICIVPHFFSVSQVSEHTNTRTHEHINTNKRAHEHEI